MAEEQWNQVVNYIGKRIVEVMNQEGWNGRERLDFVHKERHKYYWRSCSGLCGFQDRGEGRARGKYSKLVMWFSALTEH